MADDTSTQDGNNTSGDTSAAGDEFKPITSQDDLNRVLDARLKREREKFADYKDVKAKASRLDEIEQASKSEAQKATDRLAAAEKDVAVARRESLRLRVAAKHGISDDDADLFLNGDDEATLTRQAERLTGRETERKKQGNHVPREGNNSTTIESADREVVRAVFGGPT